MMMIYLIYQMQIIMLWELLIVFINFMYLYVLSSKFNISYKISLARWIQINLHLDKFLGLKYIPL